MKDTLLTLNELLSAVDGRLLTGFDAAVLEKDFCFRSVVTDSRFVSINSLFVPLIGEFQNGHKYVPQAVREYIEKADAEAGEGSTSPSRRVTRRKPVSGESESGGTDTREKTEDAAEGDCEGL